MELLKYNDKKETNGLKYGSVKRISFNYDTQCNYFRLTMKPGEYKNAQSRTKPKSYIIGDSNNIYLNPYKFFEAYIKRLTRESYNTVSHLNIDKNANIFQWFDGTIITIDKP